MIELSIFKNMSSEDIDIFLKEVSARKLSFRKDELIFSKFNDNDLTGIIISGSANIIKYDYNGNRIIIDYLEYDSIFGKPFLYYDNDISIVASSSCEILFIDYNLLINNKIINANIIDILSIAITKINIRIELLSKKTIRERLLCYFNLIAKKKKRKTFNLPITYIELSDYLSVDRSAMMRELKKLKNEKIISINEKKISLLE